MKISEIRPDEYDRATEVWEASVRATHAFVSDSDIEIFRPLVRQGFGQIEHLAGLRDDDGLLVGFAGVEDEKLEMLFLHPAARGQGGGKLLLHHALTAFGARHSTSTSRTPKRSASTSTTASRSPAAPTSTEWASRTPSST